VLEDNYQTNLAGLALPKRNTGRLAYFTDFLDEMKRSGSLQRLVNDSGLRGVEVAMPK
jgi:hypothetical protein